MSKRKKSKLSAEEARRKFLQYKREYKSLKHQVNLLRREDDSIEKIRKAKAEMKEIKKKVKKIYPTTGVIKLMQLE